MTLVKWRDPFEIQMQREGVTKTRKGDSLGRWKEETTELGKSIENKNEKVQRNTDRLGRHHRKEKNWEFWVCGSLKCTVFVSELVISRCDWKLRRCCFRVGWETWGSSGHIRNHGNSKYYLGGDNWYASLSSLKIVLGFVWKIWQREK